MASSISNNSFHFRSSDRSSSKRSAPEGSERVESRVTKVARSRDRISEPSAVSDNYSVIIPIPIRPKATSSFHLSQLDITVASPVALVRSAAFPIIFKKHEIDLFDLYKKSFIFIEKYKNLQHIKNEDCLFFQNGKLFYKGETNKGIPHGTGTMLLSARLSSTKVSNIVITGQFFAGKPDGYGMFVDLGKFRYEGFFKTGLRHGQGTITSTDGKYHYSGAFENDQFHGKGTLKKASGEIYVGQFENGQFHGKGMLISPKGKKYIGNFENNMAHGSGATILEDGRVHRGLYQSGEMHGPGIISFPDGRICMGSWERGYPVTGSELLV